MKEYKKFLKNVSKRVGLTIDQIKEISPEDLREYLISKNKKPFKIVSQSLFKTMSTEEIEKELDKFLN